MMDSETDQLCVTKSFSSRSTDAGVGTIIGNSGDERKLRIFSIAGQCMLERTAQEMQSYNHVSDLIHMLCQTTGMKPCRLVLLDGRVRLQPSQGFKALWPPLDDFELQVIVVPGPSLDLGHELTLKCAEFLTVQRLGPLRLAVRFQCGKLLETIQEEVTLNHRVTLSVPSCFRQVHMTSAETADASDADGVVELHLESFFDDVMSTCFRELKMHYSLMTLDFWVTGEFHSHLGGCKRQQCCHGADLQGLVRTTLVLCLYWLSDLFSTASSLWLVVMMLTGNVTGLLPLLFSLWLPGLAFSWRFHFYIHGRTCRGFCKSEFCVARWLCGMQPAGLIIASVVLPAYFAYKMILLILHLCDFSAYEPPFPLNPDMFALYEIYMRDVRLLGDVPRSVILLCLLLFSNTALPQAKLHPALVGSMLALLLARLPHRSRMRHEAWRYFDHIIMEEEDLNEPN